MKRLNYKRKQLTSILILSVFISSFLIYSPANIALSAPGDPVIEVITPEEGSSFEDAMVEFTGKVFDDVTAPGNFTIKVFEQVSETEDVPLDITNEGTLTEPNKQGYWSFSKEFSEGSHSLIFVVENENGKTSNFEMSFTINDIATVDSSETAVTESDTDTDTDTTSEREEETSNETEMNIQEENNDLQRPDVVDIKLFAYDKQPFVEAYQPADYYGNLVETDDEPSMDQYISAINKEMLGGSLSQVRLNSQILITFNEHVKLADDNGETIIPLIVTTINKESNEEEQVELELISYDEQKFEAVVAPASDSTELWKPATTYYGYINPDIKNTDGGQIITKSFKFTTRPLMHSDDVHGGYRNNTNSCANCHSTHNGNDEKLSGGKYGNNPDGVCMACHDGTLGTGTPSPDKMDADNQHNQMHEVTKDEGYSCASCHNPHASWTPENPNKLKRSYEDENKNTAEMAYKKLPGKTEDFNLCLRCHKENKASDIEQYYNNEESGHNFMFEEDESGKMPCADCHETHGSSNYASLKENLGHIKRSENDKFSETEWTAENERAFCLSCHNNQVDIELYGKKATLSLVNAENKPISAHQPDSKSACSNCHGVSDSGDPAVKQKQKRMSAAHAPKRIQPKPAQ